MHLLVGLGNPGAAYAGNRHNIGFMALDAIHARHGFSPWRSRFSARISDGEVGAHKVTLAKPTTFMNLSGQSVGEVTRFYKLDASDVTVIHDELDLEPGRTRIKTGGGHGGHNGLKSLDTHLGKNYRRIRLGIGHPGHKDLVSGYVLKDFPKSDLPWVEALCDEVGRSIELALLGNDSDLNAKLNEATAPWRKEPKAEGEPPSRKIAPPTGQSHIRQARQTPKPDMPKTGPMADLLKKLLGNQDPGKTD